MDTTTTKSTQNVSPVTTNPDLTTKTGNKFVFRDPSGKTNITYYPCAPGPPVVGQKSGPELDYEGEEGKHVFRAEEITAEDTRLGKLVSVVIPQVEHVGMRPLTVMLCLPPVNIAADVMSQAFTTFAVKCHGQRQGYMPGPGTPMSYQLMHIEGTAMCEFMPMTAAN